MIGASEEVIRHHIRQHPCDDAAPDLLICPHDVVSILACGVCGEYVFAFVRHGAHCADVDEVLPRLVRGGWNE